MSQLLPTIQASGLWVLKSPYQHLLDRETWYTCIAVRRIEDLLRLGVDVYKDYYQTYKLDDNTYQTDIKAGVCIITVKDTSGVAYSFPSSYLASFPKGGGIPYQVLALAIDLGAIPVDKDLSHLQTALKELVQSTLGVTNEARLVNLSTVELVDRASHLRLEAERARLITKHVLPVVKVQQLEAELAKAKNYIAELERFAVSRNP